MGVRGVDSSRAGGTPSASRSAAGLNPKQQRFASEYSKDPNGKQAAVRAGYSPRTAESQASRLLRNAKVAALVGQLQAKQLAKIDASAERVKEELARVAFADVGRAFDARGRHLPVHKLPEDLRRAVSGFEHHGKVRKVKFWSKPEALGLLAKHHGLLREILEVRDVTETRNITDEEWSTLSRLEHEVRGG